MDNKERGTYNGEYVDCRCEGQGMHVAMMLEDQCCSYERHESLVSPCIICTVQRKGLVGQVIVVAGVWSVYTVHVLWVALISISYISFIMLCDDISKAGPCIPTIVFRAENHVRWDLH